MSYCVNCGVELCKSERTCPLCDTEVVNPKEPWEEPERRPYPKRIEALERRATRRVLLWTASLLLLIPILITTVCDLIYFGRITWSAYVIGSAALAYIFVITPFLMRKPHPGVCIVLDAAASGLFLYSIEYHEGGNWFLPLALPILLLSAAAFLFLAVMFTQKHPLKLVRVALALFSAGALSVALEFVINRYTRSALMFEWSLYVLVVCVIFGIIALLINKRRVFKEEVRRRFFV